MAALMAGLGGALRAPALGVRVSRPVLAGWARLAHGGGGGDYLHETAIPTYHFQDSLPKLQLPKLDATIKKYLDSARPLLSDEEFAVTENLAREFEKGFGSELQTELTAINKSKYSSYIAEPWSAMYLEDRKPIVINSNPQLTWLDDPVIERNNQAVRASNLVISSVRFFRTLRDQKLKPDVFHTKKYEGSKAYETTLSHTPRPLAWGVSFLFGAYALDMSQYNRLFQSTRIPKVGKDELASFPDSRHIVVQRGPEFFAVDVLDEAGDALPDKQIASQMAGIMAREPGSGPHVGLLTTMGRDEWANARDELCATPANQESLGLVDSALFTLTLEEQAPTSLHDQSRCMLHGEGRNRWYDKSIHLIVCSNGKSAVNFEHAWGDGVAVLRFFDEVYKDAVKSPMADTSAPATMEPLRWDLSDKTVATIDRAGAEYDAFNASMEQKILETCIINSDFVKEHKLKVDGFLQMSFQLAHYRMYGHSASTYESASTAGFKHGRTETIRSATNESNAMCKAFYEGAPREEKEALMRAAIEKHAKLSKACLLGGGWDRHLFALRDIAERQHGTVPPLFTDTAYAKLGKIILSTSTLASPALDGGGFGPVNPDCYGIGYGIREFGSRYVVSSYHKETDAFIQILHQCLKDMRAVVEGKDVKPYA